MRQFPQILLSTVLAVMILASAGSATALARSRDRVPLASVVAVSLEDDQGTGAENIAEYVKALVAQYAVGGLAPDCQFPLMNVSTDSVGHWKVFAATS